MAQQLSHQQAGGSPTIGDTPENATSRMSPLEFKRHTLSGWVIGLSVVWPEILENVPEKDRALAEQALMMPLVSVTGDDLATVMSRHTPGALDFLIVDGFALKQTTLARQRALELLGPGDLLAPPLNAARQLESRSVSRYVGHGQVSLVAINARFGQTARHWPGIADILHERLGQQTHRASMHAAMLHLPRIEDRILALFADLAERFGRVSTAGILVDLRLTHEVIGGLVGSRRPTVTLGLKQLASQGLIVRCDNDRWTLSRSIVSS